MTDTPAAPRMPTGHDGPCCGSCYDEQDMYDRGEIDHSHDMHPQCCCRDQRSYDEAEAAYKEWSERDDKDFTVLTD